MESGPQQNGNMNDSGNGNVQNGQQPAMGHPVPPQHQSVPGFPIFRSERVSRAQVRVTPQQILHGEPVEVCQNILHGHPVTNPHADIVGYVSAPRNVPNVRNMQNNPPSTRNRENH